MKLKEEQPQRKKREAEAGTAEKQAFGPSIFLLAW
jgi:hypothetical protein